MQIRLFLGGRSPPRPSHRVELWGNRVSPSPCLRAQPSQTLPRVGEWGNPVSPFPCGAGAWGNPLSPPPSPRAYVHVSRPCGSAAPRRDEHTSWEGVALPNPPTGWGNGETGFPHPPRRGRMFTLAVHAAPPHPDGMKTGCSWEGCALPHPPAGGGMGETRFPHSPRRGLMFSLEVRLRMVDCRSRQQEALQRSRACGVSMTLLW